MVSRDGFGSPVPRQPAHLHTRAESGAYFRDFSRVPRRRPFIYFKPLYAIGSVPSLSGRAIAYRWRSLQRVRRHRTSKSQGSSKRVLPWQVTMDQLMCASLSHTHYWYEVDMLELPAVQYAGTGYYMVYGIWYMVITTPRRLFNIYSTVSFNFTCMSYKRYKLHPKICPYDISYTVDNKKFRDNII